MELSRRSVLLGTAATLLASTASSAEAADEFDTLRLRWQVLLTGSGFDPSAAPYAAALASLGKQAAGYRDAMSPATKSLWPDLPLGTASSNITGSYTRLKTMALAHVQPGTGLTGDATLAAQITSGLDYLHTNTYNEATARYGNWWDWQIGAPEALLDTCVLSYPQLTSAQLTGYCAAIDHFVPDSVVASYTGTSTGANRADLCRVIALRGVISRNSAKISTAATALSPIFPYVTTGDGMYVDGSFVQHTWTPYTGTYGEVMLGDLGRLFALLAGSTWAVTDPQRANVLDSVTRAFAPFIVNGLVMDGVSGRAISRSPQNDHTRGHALLSDILLLADSGIGTTQQSATWKSMVKGWIQRDTVLPYMSDPGVGVPELARAQALLTDSSISPAPEPVGHRLFGMDRAVHRRPGWVAAISMCSARTTFYENGNGENLRGWHTNAGMLYWWGTAFDQYSDAFWPTVDPYRLPGTTVSTKPLADGEGGAWGAPRPAARFAGGATDGTYAVVGQDVRGLSSTLTAKKSWFCLDDTVVCLGSGITAADGTTVESIVDNRNLGADGANGLVVDGVAQPGTLGWSQRFRHAQSITISGVGSYVFPGGAAVNALRQARTGNGGITRNYLTLWFDHGTNPSDASYFYLLMPGADAATAARRKPPKALANTAAVQAVMDVTTGTIGANFYAPGSAGPITVNAPCSVLVRQSQGTLTIAVSDPTQTATTITVTFDGAATQIVSSDPKISVTSLHPVTLKADVTGAHGASRKVVLRQPQ